MNTLNKKNNYIQNYMLMGLKRRLYNMALFYMAMIIMLAGIRKYGNEKLVTISRD